MVKKWLCAAGLGLAMSASADAQEVPKIAIVNISSIFQQLSVRETVAQKLKNEFKGHSDELQNIKHNLQTKMQHLQRDGATMKDRDRRNLEKEVIMQREQFSRKAQALEQDNRRRQMEEYNKIISRIQDTVKSVASKEGYNIVIDANAIAYASDSKDITTDVLKQVK